MEQENKPNDTQNTNFKNKVDSKKKLGLPITALLFNIIPYVLFLIEPNVILLMLMSIFPFIGFIMGIVALCEEKKHIGKSGIIISIIAISWSIVFIVTVISFSTIGSLTMDM